MGVIIVSLLVIIGFDFLKEYFKNGETSKSEPKDLKELEKDVEEKTESYLGVVHEVEKTEERVKEIKKKSEIKK